MGKDVCVSWMWIVALKNLPNNSDVELIKLCQTANNTDLNNTSEWKPYFHKSLIISAQI